MTLNGARTYDLSVQVPGGILLDGDNSLQVVNVGDAGATLEAVFVDWLEVDHRRPFLAPDGHLTFTLDETGQQQVTVEGLSSDKVVVVDLTAHPDRYVRRTAVAAKRRAQYASRSARGSKSTDAPRVP